MKIPFFKELNHSKSILIAGAGGGFDIVSGIPLYLYLRSLGKKVVLSNLSFTILAFSNSEEIYPGIFRVTRDSESLPYFPEKYIVEWLHCVKNESPEMYALSKKWEFFLYPRPIQKSSNYIALIQRFWSMVAQTASCLGMNQALVRLLKMPALSLRHRQHYRKKHLLRQLDLGLNIT